MIAILTNIICISILYISFTIQGIYEEKIYSSKYTFTYINKNQEMRIKEFKFKEPNLNFVIISVLSVVISGIIILSKRMDKKLFSFKDKMILGVLYTVGKYCNENSLKYLDFISKTIAKSCKSLSSKLDLIILYFTISCNNFCIY